MLPTRCDRSIGQVGQVFNYIAPKVDYKTKNGSHAMVIKEKDYR